jgi:hypothetical protein
LQIEQTPETSTEAGTTAGKSPPRDDELRDRKRGSDKAEAEEDQGTVDSHHSEGRDGSH